MNQIDVEYAIKKDVRNNPIVREADRRQGHEFARAAGAWVLILSMGLFAAWQHFEVMFHGYEIEKVMKEKAEEEAINRRLRLQIETLRSPQRIERIATNDLRMIVPPATSTLPLSSSVAVCSVRSEVIDPVSANPCSSTSIVASCGVADCPPPSSTETAIGNAPTTVGVPASVPSAANPRPGGNCPVSLHVSGAIPSVATNTLLYGRSTAPFDGAGDVAMVGGSGGSMMIVLVSVVLFAGKEESVTVIRAGYVPAVVGVPPMEPLEARVMPGGNDDAVQKNGARPWVELNTKLF